MSERDRVMKEIGEILEQPIAVGQAHDARTGYLWEMDKERIVAQILAIEGLGVLAEDQSFPGTHLGIHWARRRASEHVSPLSEGARGTAEAALMDGATLQERRTQREIWSQGWRKIEQEGDKP